MTAEWAQSAPAPARVPDGYADALAEVVAGAGHAALLPAQRVAERWIVGRLALARGAVLADETGLGKTWVALAVASGLQGPVDVVAPSRTHPAWRRIAEQLGVTVVLHRWGAVVRRVAACDRSAWVGSGGSSGSLSQPDPRFVGAGGPTPSVVAPSAGIVGLRGSEGIDSAIWAGPAGGLVIVDEAHALRHRGTQRYAAFAAALAARRVLLLTATPWQNRDADVVHLLRLFVRSDRLWAWTGTVDWAAVEATPERAARLARALVLARDRADVVAFEAWWKRNMVVPTRSATCAGSTSGAQVDANADRPEIALDTPPRTSFEHPPEHFAGPAPSPATLAVGIRPRRVQRLPEGPSPANEWEQACLQVAAVVQALPREGSQAWLQVTLLRRLASSQAALLASLKALAHYVETASASARAGQQVDRRSWRRHAARGETGEAEQGVLALFWGEAPSLDREAEHPTEAPAIDWAAAQSALDQARACPGPDDAVRWAPLIEAVASASGAVLLFTEYRATARALFGLLRARLPVSWLDGDGARDSVWQRVTVEACLALHQTQRTGPRALITTAVGAEGLDLPATEVVVHVDLPWNPAVLQQRTGRADRLGSVAPLQVWVREAPPELQRALRQSERLLHKETRAAALVGVRRQYAPGWWAGTEPVQGVGFFETRAGANPGALNDSAASVSTSAAPLVAGAPADSPADPNALEHPAGASEPEYDLADHAAALLDRPARRAALRAAHRWAALALQRGQRALARWWMRDFVQALGMPDVAWALDEADEQVLALDLAHDGVPTRTVAAWVDARRMAAVVQRASPDVSTADDAPAALPP